MSNFETFEIPKFIFSGTGLGQRFLVSVTGFSFQYLQEQRRSQKKKIVFECCNFKFLDVSYGYILFEFKKKNRFSS